MSMSPEVKAEYDRIVTEIALRNGSLMDLPGSRFYGWIANPVDGKHFSRCGVSTHGTAEETTFTQFEGTFETGVRYRSAFDVPDVSCKCGQLRDRAVRWEVSDFSDVMTTVFEEMYRQLKGNHSE